MLKVWKLWKHESPQEITAEQRAEKYMCVIMLSGKAAKYVFFSSMVALALLSSHSTQRFNFRVESTARYCFLENYSIYNLHKSWLYARKSFKLASGKVHLTSQSLYTTSFKSPTLMYRKDKTILGGHATSPNNVRWRDGARTEEAWKPAGNYSKHRKSTLKAAPRRVKWEFVFLVDDSSLVSLLSSFIFRQCLLPLFTGVGNMLSLCTRAR